MKKTILFSILPLMALFVFISAYEPAPVPEDIDLGWPEEVMTLLERSCFDCHTAESGNVKAKGKLNFSKWNSYKLTKQISKLDGIRETIEQKDMPPKKYIEKKPEAVFTDEEITLITGWADAEIDSLMGE
jgi:hypothetical protein